jgi:hypothetical protein
VLNFTRTMASPSSPSLTKTSKLSICGQQFRRIFYFWACPSTILFILIEKENSQPGHSPCSPQPIHNKIVLGRSPPGYRTRFVAYAKNLRTASPAAMRPPGTSRLRPPGAPLSLVLHRQATIVRIQGKIPSYASFRISCCDHIEFL